MCGEDSPDSVTVHVDEHFNERWGKLVIPVDSIHCPGGDSVICLSAVIIGYVYFFFELFSVLHDECVSYDSVYNTTK